MSDTTKPAAPPKRENAIERRRRQRVEIGKKVRELFPGVERPTPGQVQQAVDALGIEPEKD